MNDMLLTVDAAWLCAAEMDVEREELERREALARRQRRQIRGKYELKSTSAQLELELKSFQLERRQKVAKVYKAQSLTPLQESCINRNQLVSPPAAANSTKASTNTTIKQKSKEKKRASVYAMENVRLAMLMRDKALQERIKIKKRRPRVVDDMLALEKRYAASAKQLQHWWRACQRRWFWKSLFKKVQACIHIQRMARGMLCRGWVRAWHTNRTYRATRLQAAFRGFYMRTKVTATWKQWEFINATKIQAIVRGHAARKRFTHHKRLVAALHIQMLWRGYTSRKQSDLLWLAHRAINLQRLVRGMRARKAVRKRQVAVHSAATQIQRMFRGVQARAVVNTLLRERETRNRLELMRVLEAEEEWHRIQRDKVQKRLERLQLHREVCEMEEQYYRNHERISDMESIYLDMQTQRLRVSPRAIEQGWVEEMEEKMKLQRAAITQLKLETIFTLGLEFKRNEEKLLKFQTRIRELEGKRRKVRDKIKQCLREWLSGGGGGNCPSLTDCDGPVQFEIWREEEFLDYWERECLHQHKLKMIEKRRNVTEQRRKWAIQRFHNNGKPDRRWKCGKWSADVLAQAKKKEIFCVANTDLLADIQSKWRKHLLEGERCQTRNDDVEETIREVDDLTNQVALVATHAQIEQTKAIFDPVFHDIEKSYLQVQNQQRGHDKKRQAIRARELKLKSQSNESLSVKQATESLDLVKKDAATTNQSREQRKRQLIQAAKIPWQLLDQLAAERRKLEEEKVMFKVWGKSHVALRQHHQSSDKLKGNETTLS